MKLNPNTLMRIFNWFHLQYQKAVESTSGKAAGSRTAWPPQFLTIVRGKDAKWWSRTPCSGRSWQAGLPQLPGKIYFPLQGYYGGAQTEALNKWLLDSEICSEQRTFRTKVLLIWKHIFLVYLLLFIWSFQKLVYSTIHAIVNEWLSVWVYISCTV